MGNLIVEIENESYLVQEGSFQSTGQIAEASKCQFIIRDDYGAFRFNKWEEVVVTDDVEGVKFTGFVNFSKERKVAAQQLIWHTIDCIDNHAIFDKKTTNKLYSNVYGGIAVADMARALQYEIIAKHAIRNDSTQADFAAGNLSNTIATTNVDDGCLELSPAGSKVTITESTTSNFSTGTLSSVTAANNTLRPDSEAAIKMQCTQTGVAQDNTYTYVKIFQPASTFTVNGTCYLFYKIFITSDSPEAKFGVDITFTDNTSLRDNFTTGEVSQNNLSPHPGTDLAGYADGRWYGRTFDLTSFSGKNIAYISIACEGDKPGTYTAYFKSIQYLNSDFSNNQYFFQNSLNVNPVQQLKNQGYSQTSVSVVTTYEYTENPDTTTFNFRDSPSYDISNVGILKSSFISWKADEPDNTRFFVKYSIDGGNSFILCENNAPLPALPAGSKLTGTSIILAEEFSQKTGSNPEETPVLHSMKLVFNASYAASKTDVNYASTSSAVWQNTGTFSNTQVSGLFLQLVGSTRYFDENSTNNEMSNITLFGGKATGPNNANTCFQYINKKQFSLQVHQSTEARSRMDFAGQFADGTLEFDIYIDNSNMKDGCVYRTSNWSNYDANYAYAVEIFGTTIALQKGSNSSASSDGTRTQVAIATVNLTSQAIHRIKVVFSGSSHQIFLDDVRVINATDSTYTGAGYVGFRVSNTDASNGYISFFDNFGIMKTLTGTWTSNNISLTTAANYGDSAVYWEDYSIDSQSTSLLVEASINGGSSYSTCANGAPIPGLTLGQSLSGVNLKFRVTLTTAAATSMPQIRYLVARILGQYSASGTRISPALDLSPAVVAGSTLAAYDALLPSGTSVQLATSLNGTSFTIVNSGDPISGIAGQPDATLDTFDTNTASAYTSTARTSGTAAVYMWNTANSRITVSGGTNALLLRTGLSKKDVDLMLDLDQADCSGLVWRRTDNSNFYELDIFDDTSNAGSTNKLKLYKVVSNVKTQLGTDISISFTRGVPKRVRVKMVGSAIDIYDDSLDPVRSTTDSSLSGAGLCGLINVSGSAQFYNLRIQPQGDSLAGQKTAYLKLTLNSTDPTQTPQVLTSTLAALSPNIELGPLIPTLDWRRKFMSDNMADVSDKSNKYWQVDKNKELFFVNRQSIPAPWILHSSDTNLKLAGPLTVENSGDKYMNRAILTGVKDTKSVTESKVGNSKDTSWVLQYNVDSAPTITLNGQTATVGLKGATGYDFYYEVGSNSIAQDDAGDLLTEIDELIFAYTAQFETEVVRDNLNAGDFPGTISQEEFIDISSQHPFSFTLLNQASAAQSASGSTSDIDVSKFETINIDIPITAHSGTNPTVQFTLKRKDASGTYFTLWTSSVSTAATDTISISVGPSCTVPESLGSTVLLSWTIGGTSSPSVTFGLSIKGHLDLEASEIGVVEYVEDVSDQGLDVEGAEDYGDALLQENGVIGRTLRCKVTRAGLDVGQYWPVFLNEHHLWDENMLITDIQMTQKSIANSGNPTQYYEYDVTANSGPNLGSWQKLLKETVKA